MTVGVPHFRIDALRGSARIRRLITIGASRFGVGSSLMNCDEREHRGFIADSGWETKGRVQDGGGSGGA